jgi:hypothetical protein
MTKHLHNAAALALGALLATIIACGGAGGPAKSIVSTNKVAPHDEIARLDAQIAADLVKLDEPRPPSPVEPMTARPVFPQSDDPTCHPAQTATCTDSCTLKTSICDAAKRICTIASDLGNTDAYANEKCSSGAASCDAATKRCCNCT